MNEAISSLTQEKGPATSFSRSYIPSKSPHLYSPKPSAGLRPNIASPAASTSSPPATAATYNNLPAIERVHRYVVTGTLQQSLFGVVTLAFDRLLKQQVAIKISRKERAQQRLTRSGDSVPENVKREAAVMRYLAQRSAAGSAATVVVEKRSLYAEIFSNVTINQILNRKGEGSINVEGGGGGRDAQQQQLCGPIDSTDLEGERYICHYVDEMEDEHFHYLVTDFIPAGDFYSMLTSFPHHRLSEGLARRLFRQMVLGVKYLHLRNVAHLDMSLENMCVDMDDSVRIIDFGVAALHPFTNPNYRATSVFVPSASSPNSLSSPSPLSSSPACPSPPSIILTSPCVPNPPRTFPCKPVKKLYAKPGKVRYMSPELFQGLAWDAFANDVFSLGVILYSLLTGRPPFQQAASSDVWFHVIYSGQWLTPQIRKQSSAHVYTHLSDAALQLINDILKPQDRRPTCEQILQHPWMQME